MEDEHGQRQIEVAHFGQFSECGRHVRVSSLDPQHDAVGRQAGLSATQERAGTNRRGWTRSVFFLIQDPMSRAVKGSRGDA